MSPQSSLHISSLVDHALGGVEMSKSEIVAATSVAFDNEQFHGGIEKKDTSRSTNNQSPPSLSLISKDIDKSAPRFSLRKRKVCDTDSSSPPSPTSVLPTINADFLSGIFADIASSTSNGGSKTLESTATTTTTSEDTCALDNPASEADQSIPNLLPRVSEEEEEKEPSRKKSRFTLNRILSRHKSYTSLAGAAELCRTENDVSPSVSPSPSSTVPTVSCDPSPVPRGRKVFGDSEVTIDRHDSLALQLNTLQGSQPLSQNPRPIDDSVFVAFPHLPATISCSNENLTRMIKGRRHASLVGSSIVNNLNNDPDQKGETYGWFVEMDSDNEGRIGIDAYSASSVTDELAFQAPTAPKKSDKDAEVEWAKAADTVDDVLGDFF